MPTTEQSQPSGSPEHVTLAPWRSPLSRALHRNRAVPFCRYLQLATVKLDGTPANRTVVFRGFLAETNRLMFISDLRSDKTHQVQHNPNAEACWYFTKTREQFRLSGQLVLITAKSKGAHQSARQQIWQNISENARRQFAWPHPKESRVTESRVPGSRVPEPGAADAFNPPAPDEQAPPETFTLLLLSPHSVDHLELRGDPQSRHLYQQESNELSKWSVIEVNP